jgi:hypothetical protein
MAETKFKLKLSNFKVRALLTVTMDFSFNMYPGNLLRQKTPDSYWQLQKSRSEYCPEV